MSIRETGEGSNSLRDVLTTVKSTCCQTGMNVSITTFVHMANIADVSSITAIDLEAAGANESAS